MAKKRGGSGAPRRHPKDRHTDLPRGIAEWSSRRFASIEDAIQAALRLLAEGLSIPVVAFARLHPDGRLQIEAVGPESPHSSPLLGLEVPRPLAEAARTPAASTENAAFGCTASAPVRGSMDEVYGALLAMGSAPSGDGEEVASWLTVVARVLGAELERERHEAENRAAEKTRARLETELDELQGARREAEHLGAVADAAQRRAALEEQLIGIVSHDLRNPLSAVILGATAILSGPGLSESTRKTALRIRSAADRAARLVRDLLDLTQVQLGGGLQVHPERTNIHGLAEQVLDEVSLAYPNREIVLLKSGDGEGLWDADRVAQVITNLLTNAAQYSAADSRVLVSTRDLGEAVELEVHNFGQVISPDLLARVFEPLQRGPEVDPGTRSVGLGLFIAKHVVEAHGGTISAQSTAEGGTRFIVHLPRFGYRGP